MAIVTERFGENTADDYSGVTEDTQLDEGNATTNYGGSATMQVLAGSNFNFRSVLSFDLSSATVKEPTSVTLSVYLSTNMPAITMECWINIEDWVEAQATWNDRQTGEPWNTGGRDKAANHGKSWKVGEVDLSSVASGSRIDFSMDPNGDGFGDDWGVALTREVLAALRGFGTPAGRINFTFVSATGNNVAAVLHTSEAADGLRPYISITGDNVQTTTVVRRTIGDNTADDFAGGIEDAHLHQQNPGTNYGTATTLRVRNRTTAPADVFQTILKAQLTQLKTEFPGGFDPIYVRLHLTISSIVGAATMQGWLCEEDWNVGEATWNDKKTSTPWSNVATHGAFTEGSFKEIKANGLTAGKEIIFSWSELERRGWFTLEGHGHGDEGLADWLQFVIYQTTAGNTPDTIFHSSTGTDGSRPYVEIVGIPTNRTYLYSEDWTGKSLGAWDPDADTEFTLYGGTVVGNYTIELDSESPTGRAVLFPSNRPTGFGLNAAGIHTRLEVLALIRMGYPGAINTDGPMYEGCGPWGRLSGATAGAFRGRGAAPTIRDSSFGAPITGVASCSRQAKNDSGNQSFETTPLAGINWAFIRIQMAGAHPDEATGVYRVSAWYLNQTEPGSWEATGSDVSGLEWGSNGGVGVARIAHAATAAAAKVAWLGINTAPWIPGSKAPTPCAIATISLSFLELTSTTVRLLTSAYSGLDTHTSTDWEIQLAGGDWTTPVWQSLADATNLVSIDPSALLTDTLYEARARHNDGCGTGAWDYETFSLGSPLWNLGTSDRMLSLSLDRLKNQGEQVWHRATREISRPAIWQASRVVYAGLNDSIYELDRGGVLGGTWVSPTLNRGIETAEYTLTQVFLLYEAASATTLTVEASADGGNTWVAGNTTLALTATVGSERKRVRQFFNTTGHDLRFRITFPANVKVLIHGGTIRVVGRGDLDSE